MTLLCKAPAEALVPTLLPSASCLTARELGHLIGRNASLVGSQVKLRWEGKTSLRKCWCEEGWLEKYQYPSGLEGASLIFNSWFDQGSVKMDPQQSLDGKLGFRFHILAVVKAKCSFHSNCVGGSLSSHCWSIVFLAANKLNKIHFLFPLVY